MPRSTMEECKAATTFTTETSLTPLHIKNTRCKLVIVEGMCACQVCVCGVRLEYEGWFPHCRVRGCSGNISAGKSTLCRTLANDLQYVLYLEPTVRCIASQRLLCVGSAPDLWAVNSDGVLLCCLVLVRAVVLRRWRIHSSSRTTRTRRSMRCRCNCGC